MVRTLCCKDKNFIDMNRSIVFLLAMLFTVVSCGTSSQFAQQRYYDGIYRGSVPANEPVHIYTEEEFVAMAAANIARESRQQSDTVYVVIDNSDDYSWYNSPWYAWGAAWTFGSPYWWHRHWPYYGWAGSWWYYDYWWYYDWWYYDWWFYRPYHFHPLPSLHHDFANRYYGPRRGIQGTGSMYSRPGSVNPSRSAVRGTGSSASMTRVYSNGTSGNSSYTRRSSGSTTYRTYSSGSSNSYSSGSNSTVTRSRNYTTPSSTSRSGSYSTPSSSSRSGFSGGGSAARSGGGGGGSRGGGRR